MVGIPEVQPYSGFSTFPSDQVIIFLAWGQNSRISSIHSLSRVRLFATPWISARQASLSITNSRSSLRLNVHWVSDAIQPSHPLSSPSPPAPNPSQHQYLQIIVIIILLYNLYNRNMWKMLAFDGTGKCKHFSEGSLWEGLCWLKGTFLI